MAWWLAIFLAVPVWRVARRVAPVLVSRYDSAALRVKPPAAVAASLQKEPVTQDRGDALGLAAWCSVGAGLQGGSFWRPGAPPALETPLAVALWRGGDAPAAARQIEDFSRHLDGSDRLAATRGALGGLALRCRVKCHDAMWWRARQSSDPWDCGYLGCEPRVQQALRRFRPHRATLMVAHAWPAPALQQALESLLTQRADFQHPVRVLVTGNAPPEWRLPTGVLVSELGAQTRLVVGADVSVDLAP
jgi:hypothetical protein